MLVLAVVLAVVLATVNISPTVPPIPVQFKKSKNTIASASATAPVLAASGLSLT